MSKHDSDLRTNLLRTVIGAIGVGALDIVVTLFTLVIIEGSRAGIAGVGTYSYLLSVYILSRYLIGLGVPAWIERRCAQHLDLAKVSPMPDVLAARRAVFISALAGLFFFLLIPVVVTGMSAVSEGYVSYLLIGIAIILHNINRVSIGAMNGMGRHEDALLCTAYQRLWLLPAVFITLIVTRSALWLPLAFILSECAGVFHIRKRFRVRGTLRERFGLRGVGDVYEEAQRGMFTDEAIGFILFTDFLVLGMVVNSAALGVYAEATLMARLLLLIPLGVRPLVARHLSRLSAVPSGTGDQQDMFDRARTIAGWILVTHLALALIIEAGITGVLGTFFSHSGRFMQQKELFDILLWGFVPYAALLMLDPLYALSGRIERLRSITITVLITNFILNIYLIPYGKALGAAAGTVISLILYLVLFDRGLSRRARMARPEVLAFLLGGYLILWGRGVFGNLPALLSMAVIAVAVGVLARVTGVIDSDVIIQSRMQSKEEYRDAGKGQSTS